MTFEKWYCPMFSKAWARRALVRQQQHRQRAVTLGDDKNILSVLQAVCG
jgi:hypothetical protein